MIPHFKKFVASIVVLSSSLVGCATAGEVESQVVILRPYKIVMSQGGKEASELRVVPTCGQITVIGNVGVSNGSSVLSITGLLGEFCDDWWGFRLNKSYIVSFFINDENENRIENAAEIVLWNSDGIYVQSEQWLQRKLPVEYETVLCAAAPVGPFGMTDFEDEICLLFDPEEFAANSLTDYVQN